MISRSKAIATLAVLAASGLGAKLYSRAESCTPRFDERYVYIPAKAEQTFRVFLIPGMDGTAANFLSAAVNRQWADGLAALGADVVVLNTPIPLPCWFADGGAKYRAAFLRELDGIVADAATRHGPSRTIISGVSYGGLHAMIGYAARPGAFIGWEASMSVTKLSALDELKTVGDVPAFDPFTEMRLINSPGFLTWGGKDMRVDHRETERLYALIHVTGIGYPMRAHETVAQSITDLLHDASKFATRARKD